MASRYLLFFPSDFLGSVTDRRSQRFLRSRCSGPWSFIVWWLYVVGQIRITIPLESSGCFFFIFSQLFNIRFFYAHNCFTGEIVSTKFFLFFFLVIILKNFLILLGFFGVLSGRDGNFCGMEMVEASETLLGVRGLIGAFVVRKYRLSSVCATLLGVSDLIGALGGRK